MNKNFANDNFDIPKLIREAAETSQEFSTCPWWRPFRKSRLLRQLRGQHSEIDFAIRWNAL